MLKFFRLWIEGIDPYAIRRANKRLSELGVCIDERVLERHYLVTWQLDSLIEGIRAARRDGTQVEVQRLLADDIRDRCQTGPFNPKLVNPLAWAVIYSVIAIGAIVLMAIPLALQFAPLMSKPVFVTIGGLCLLAVVASLTFAFVAARKGRLVAQRIVGLAGAALTFVGIGIVLVMARH